MKSLAFSTLPWRHFVVTMIVLASVLPVMAQVDVLTQHNDNARTGANLNETTLTPSNVNVNQFGMLFERSVDDQIYSQPLVVSNVDIGGVKHNVVYITTVHNSVYAYDADDASRTAPYWHVNFGPPVSGHFTCHDFSGNYSIVGTPVIDKGANTMYVVDQTGSAFTHHLHALDISTGAEKAGSPVTVNISNQLQNQRPALLLANGNVYVGFGSHCDQGSYHGILIAYNASSLSEVARWNSTPSGSQGALWQSGQGPAVDSAGNIYVATGNGSFNGTSNFSMSLVKLSPSLSVLDWVAPSNEGSLSGSDTDFNSSGPMVVPGTNLVTSASKEGAVYVANTSSLGHLGGFAQRFSVSSSEVHTSLVYWDSAAVGPLVYVWGTGGHLQAHRVSPSGITTTAQASGPESLGSPRTVSMISLSANGNTDGILWADALGTLRAYDATNVSHELYNSAQNSTRDSCGSFSKNAPPTIANGKVYMASFSGHFCVYGLMVQSGNFSLSATPSSQTITAGSSTSYNVTVSPSNGFASDVTLSVAGLPTGATGSFSTNPVSGGSGSSTLAISTAGSTPAGTYTLTINGASSNPSLSHSTTVTLVVNCAGCAPDFSLSVTPASRTVSAGSSTTYTASVTPSNGFNSNVSLNVTGLPSGATASFSPNPIGGGSGSSTLTVSTTASTPAGTSTLTINGTGSSMSHSQTVSLTVTPPSQCVTASATHGWVNTPIPSQSGTFTATFDATPALSNMNSVVAISHGAGTTYAAFANLVAFNGTTGTILARNGGVYTGPTPAIPYSGGNTYHFRLTIDIPTHTYSVFVTPPEGSELTVGSGLAFRTEQNMVTSLNNYGVFVGATSGSLQVCNFTTQ